MREELKKSFNTSLIDINIESNTFFQHKLLTNDDEKLVSIIRENLENCDEFIFSVAFITLSGLTLFLEELKKLSEKNIKGKILTGDYLNFTEPNALRKILNYKNIDLRLISNKKFHPKVYLFRKDKVWTLILGSSNLTQSALTTNFEWNLKINSLNDGKIIKDILEKFFFYFNSIPPLSNEKLIKYETFYNEIKKIRLQHKETELHNKIQINSMQEKALNNLMNIYKTSDKALIISATGTGKTFLSAFAVQKSKAKRVLFVAHRKLILEKSKTSFSKIIKNKEFYIFSGENFELEKISDNSVTFAMIQTLSKDIYLNRIKKDFFDYIIIDEVHHSGAKSYQKIINYFKPKFLLGLTATPERTDNFDIFKLFNYNIAYEIRLYEALEENLLCPFHYFGISDITIDGKSIDNKSSINFLTSDARVKHILEKSNYYGYSGDKLQALVFVSNVDEAKILCEKFLENGRKAVSLNSQSSDLEREKAILDLEKGLIEFIITVDIFNEGIDIPAVNQIILLRPTLSQIIYIQQIGRGLRKNKDKEFTVILDFIANYDRNFLIPVAISQNSNFDKDSMKRFVMNGTNLIPGESTINFDEISKERIFENINSSNFSNRKLIEYDFKLLEKQLGRIPLLYDFFEKNMIEPSVILKYKKDYDSILRIFAPNEKLGNLSVLEKEYLIFLSTFFTPAKRVHEMLILKNILNSNYGENILTYKEIENILKFDFNLENQRKNVENAFLHLSKDIFQNLSNIKPYPNVLKNIGNNKFVLNENFEKSYKNNLYFKMLIDDLIKYNISFATKYFSKFIKTSEHSLKLYGEYTKQEAFWYANLDFNNGYQVSGYTPFKNEKKLMIFVTMVNSNARNIYSNIFYDDSTFNWFSKPNRYLKNGKNETIETKISQNFYNIQVFVKKANGENFYYLGEVEKILDFKEIKDSVGRPMVEYIFKLKQNVKRDLLNYLNS